MKSLTQSSKVTIRISCLVILIFAAWVCANAQQPEPKTAIDYNARGLSRYNNHDYDGALADFTKSIELDPQFWASYMVRGATREAKGDYDGAFADLDKAISLNPTFARSYSYRGHVRAQKGDLAGAMSDYGKAIELDPENAEAFANRGRAYLSTGDFNAAITDFDKAIDFSPTADVYTLRGFARDALNDDAAISDFNAALVLNPNHREALRGRGDTRAKQGDLDAAMVDYDRAIALDAKYAEAYRSRGAVRSKKEDFAGAISDFTKAIEINPQLVAAYYDRSWNYLYQGKGDAAYADAMNYLRLTPAGGSQSRFYMVLVGHLGLKQAHKGPEAAKFLAGYDTEFDSPDWPYIIIKYFLRKSTGQELLNHAIGQDKRTETRVRLYLGMDAALSGDRETALSYLRWVKENAASQSREYALAAGELKRLAAVGPK